MSRLAAGDRAAIFALNEHHGHRIVGVIRRQLSRIGFGNLDGEDLNGLVLDACMELAPIAGAWRPGGAAPWNWAEGRIRNIVNGWVGVYADSIDDDHARQLIDDGLAAASQEPDLEATYRDLLEKVPIVSKVHDAARMARLDDAALLLIVEYRIHQNQGDPSPAHTIAARHGVSPEAVRQRVSRSRRRLREVIRSDPRFAEIADLDLVA